MGISKIFASAGKFGTVVVEIVLGCFLGLVFLIFRKCVVIPVKEDTWAELVKRGYTMEEIKKAEESAKDFIIEAAKSLIGHGSEGCLQESEDSGIMDAPQDEARAQASVPLTHRTPRGDHC